MGIFHTQYTLTIGEYEIMEVSGDRSMMNRLPFPLPKKYINKAYADMMLDYNNGSNPGKIKELISKDFDKVFVDNDIAFLYILERMILACAKKGDSVPKLDELYKWKYGKEPQTKEDFERPFRERKRLEDKAKIYFAEDKTSNEKIDIQKLIANLEIILSKDNAIIGSIVDQKLFKLAGYIDSAAKLNKPTDE